MVSGPLVPVGGPASQRCPPVGDQGTGPSAFLPPQPCEPRRHPDLRVLADLGCLTADLVSRPREVGRRGRILRLSDTPAAASSRDAVPALHRGCCRTQSLQPSAVSAPLQARPRQPQAPVLPTKSDFLEGSPSLSTAQAVALCFLCRRLKLACAERSSSTRLVKSWA